MCRQLEAVARGLGMESTKTSILPELVELAHDEEATVRIVGLETVVNILNASLFDEGKCIWPFVLKFVRLVGRMVGWIVGAPGVIDPQTYPLLYATSPIPSSMRLIPSSISALPIAESEIE